jgi:hypothetical protein
VQWALPHVSWRVVFAVMAGLFFIAMLGVLWRVPKWSTDTARPNESLLRSYAPVWAHRYFRRLAPLGFVNYGIVIAVQTLWAGPWMVKVQGKSPLDAAQGLFAVNFVMLIVFWAWGAINPKLERAGIAPERMLIWGTPLSIIALTAIGAMGYQAGWLAFALFVGSASVLALSQPAVAMVFPKQLAGRALSAYNLLLFSGAFTFQWCIGLGIDAGIALGLPVAAAYQLVFVLLGLLSLAAYCWFCIYARDQTAWRGRAAVES